MSDEPLSLDEAAVAMHEMYLSYLRAGFTEHQAMELLKATLAKVSNEGTKE